MPPAERARRREREDNRRGERAQLVVLAGRERTRVEDTEREEYLPPMVSLGLPFCRFPATPVQRYPERITLVRMIHEFSHNHGGCLLVGM